MPGKSIKVGAAILAAGKASRFQAPKMLLPIFGKPLLHHLIDVACSFSDVVVISGFWHTAIQESLAHRKTALLFNANYMEGLSSSIHLAIQHTRQEQWDGLAILLGDTFVDRVHLEKLLALFKASCSVVATVKEGVLQPPALFPAAVLPLFKHLSGDQGLGAWLRAQQNVQAISAKTTLVDFDSWQDYTGFIDLKNSCFPRSP
jgi:molybdenum cofactor cytidylyltransferase